jgi:cystathionine beta-lyase family protein involved in aluminum resistance
MSFEESIQKWVSLDNQLRSIQDKTKQLREDKNKIEDGIIKYVDAHQLQNSMVKISDGKLKFTMVKQTNPLTLKYVDECLGKCIKNPEQVKLIMNYIKDSRASKNIPDIKRFYENK